MFFIILKMTIKRNRNNNRRVNNNLINVPFMAINYPAFSNNITTNKVVHFKRSLKKIFNKTQKRYYRISGLHLGGDNGEKFLKIVKVLEKTLYNYIKPNIQKKLNYKQEKVLEHYGSELSGKFYDKQNKVFKGFGIITTKMFEQVDNSEKMETKSIGHDNFISKGIVIIEDKNIDKHLLINSKDNNIIHKKSLDKLTKEFNNDSLLKLEKNNVAVINTLKIPHNNKIEKIKWEKTTNKLGELIYKEIQDEINDKFSNMKDKLD